MAKAKKIVEGGEGVSPALTRLLEKHPGIMALGEVDLNVRKVATGIWTLDQTLNGGIPMARITEIHGSGGAGKTSLACMIGAAMQKAYPERYVLYIDAESALDEILGIEIYGLDPKRTVILRPDMVYTAEKLMDALVDASLCPDFCCVILDSVAGLVTANEWARDAAEILVAPIATLLGRTIKKLSARQDPEAAAVILLNQQRHAIGNAGITTPGGSAMEFYPSLRLRLRRADPIKEGEQEIGFSCRCQVVKARYSRNRLVTSWAIIYGDEGISTLRAIVTVAMSQGLIKQSGSWFQLLGTDMKWQGMSKMIEALRADVTLFDFVKDNLKIEYTSGE